MLSGARVVQGVRAVRTCAGSGGAFDAEEGVGRGCRALVVGTDVPGTHECARGSAAEVDRAQVADVQGQVGLPVRGDAVRFAAPNGQEVAVVLAEERVVDVQDELAVHEPAARDQRTRNVQQPHPEPVLVVAHLGGIEVGELPAQRVIGWEVLEHALGDQVVSEHEPGQGSERRCRRWRWARRPV